MTPVFLGIIPLIGGVICIAGAYFQWEWFMQAENARPVIDRLGWKRARVLYAILGIALAAVGILVAAGILQLPAGRGVSVQNMASEIRLPSGEIRRVLTSIAPDYPTSLRQKGVGGKVIVRLYVSPDGTVAGTQIRSSTNDELSALAMSAVRQWVFEPRKDGGTMTIEVPLEFTVEK